jgi:hypothetical protein
MVCYKLESEVRLLTADAMDEELATIKPEELNVMRRWILNNHTENPYLPLLKAPSSKDTVSSSRESKVTLHDRLMIRTPGSASRTLTHINETQNILVTIEEPKVDKDTVIQYSLPSNALLNRSSKHISNTIHPEIYVSPSQAVKGLDYTKRSLLSIKDQSEAQLLANHETELRKTRASLNGMSRVYLSTARLESDHDQKNVDPLVEFVHEVNSQAGDIHTAIKT